MASTQTWSEGNLANAATETPNRTEMNWKNIDDSTTAYSSSPITAGSRSFTKYQAIKFAGTYNTLSGLSYYCSSAGGATPATGLTIKAAVVTAGVTPATSDPGDNPIATTAGVLTANFFNTSMGFGAGSSPTSQNPTYGNPLRTQLQTTSGASPGDIPTVTITAQWTES